MESVIREQEGDDWNRAWLGENSDEMERRYKAENRKEKGGLRKKGRTNAETNERGAGGGGSRQTTQ